MAPKASASAAGVACRYDGLIEQIGGPPTPGIGWGAGVERILLAAGERAAPPPLCDLFVDYTSDAGRRAGFELALEARRAGLSAQLEPARRSLKGQLKQAGRIGARNIAIVGEDGTTAQLIGEQGEIELQRVIPLVLPQATREGCPVGDGRHWWSTDEPPHCTRCGFGGSVARRPGTAARPRAAFGCLPSGSRSRRARTGPA
ncbi:hypothetical protein Q5424_08230 [Conexibacter sp. JD483]|uniref:hypothetical protein n=1 Tax=Conexibacter sp. JD483 TaxID=3064471 RepID=UPI00286FF838|nr:hypothetical protein [Conexibacter sp. JD483]MDR9369063.1 hypothetical protein [Conexibacter sp. JD483]